MGFEFRVKRRDASGSSSSEQKAPATPQPNDQGTEATMGALEETKGSTLAAAAAKRVENIQIVRHEGQLMIPDSITLEAAEKAIHDQIVALEKAIRIRETINAFPWDASIALMYVLNERFGWTPPADVRVSVEVDYKKVEHIAWGTFTIPGVEANFHSGAEVKDGRLVTVYTIDVKGKHEAVVREIFKKARERVDTHSIYKGKAFEIRFRDDDNEKMVIPEIHFLDVSGVDQSQLIYSKEVEDAIDASLFTPIKRVRELRDNGIPIKRGTLLHGKFGTGKTLGAAVAAKLAIEQGMTYIYCKNAYELAETIAFSKPYQDPAVLIFAEDIDRSMSGDRTISTDEILNTIDGVNSKNSNLMVVLTSNDVDSIEPALLRPGRLDAVIEVTPPDAEAAGRLVKMYGGDSLAPDIDLITCGQALVGMIPAVIAEVMQRAKLAQLKFTPVGERLRNISTEAVQIAARSMRSQLELIDRVEDVPTKAEQTIADFGQLLGTAYGERTGDNIREERRIANLGK